MLTTITTQSGATYQFDGMFCYHRGSNLGVVWALKRVPEDEINYEVETPRSMVELMEDCAPGDIQVGDRFFVGTKDYWRVASRVVETHED